MWQEYGKQLGRIEDALIVLLARFRPATPLTKDEADAIQALKEMLAKNRNRERQIQTSCPAAVRCCAFLACTAFIPARSGPSTFVVGSAVAPGKQKCLTRAIRRRRIFSYCHLGAASFDSCANASCTVVMNWAGKMMVEFFSIEISAMVCSVRSCSATGCWVMMSAAWPSFTAA